MEKQTDLRVKCDCGCHELHIERWDEKELAQEHRMWSASIWLRGYESKPGWMSRIGHIWHIILRGRPYGDEVVLNRAEMIKLFNYINQELNNT